MLFRSVPTPPIVQNYTKTIYKIDSTYEDYEINSFSKITEGEYQGFYNLDLTYKEDLPKAYTYAAKDSVITAKKTGDDYTYLNFQIGVDSYTYDSSKLSGNSIVKITDNYEDYIGLSTIMEAQGVTNGTFYMYTKNSTNYFTSEADLNSTSFNQQDDKLIYSGTYAFDYQGTYTSTQHANAIGSLVQDSTGRLSSVKVIESDDALDLIGNTYSITVSGEDDEQGYEEAMNQYHYEKDKYEQEVERINKKTAKIQAEDRGLELKLNQLDTEQNAIATEMDSVSKVIEDTIESVFKTFNS